jgi:hypothetical protein
MCRILDDENLRMQSIDTRGPFRKKYAAEDS